MKKFFCLFLVSLSLNLFAQELTVSAANKKTAQRCLQLAENFILNNDYQSAYNQAVLGLAYDNSISDLLYIKATSLNHLEGSVNAEVLATVREALEIDNWINNNKNNARILYADMLSETCNPEASLDVLNEAPLIYTADAEFIRIKDLYRIGTNDSINQAREKVETSRRIYSKDERFPYLFFMFETLFYENALVHGIDYEVPAKVQKIALDYIVKLPDYKTHKIEMEIMASLFTPEEFKTRLLKATGEKTNADSLYALAALRAGVLSEEKAFNLFFENLGSSVQLLTLEAFVSLIKDPALSENLQKHLNAFEGSVYADDNLDLINELEIVYERGRAASIKFDENNDGIIDISAFCDYGEPLLVVCEPEGFEVHYGIYPYVETIFHSEGSATFDFVGTDYVYAPFDMTVDNVFDALGVDFYVPYVSDEYVCPELSYMLLNCSHLKIQTQERIGSIADYALIAGRPHSISFYDDSGVAYAWAVTEEMFPFTRYVDYDGDGILETSEIYGDDKENLFQSKEDKEFIEKVFGSIDFGTPFYLQQIKIDRNNDGIYEYSEVFMSEGGKLSSWDSDGNGIWDYEFMRYPHAQGEDIIEETTFYSTNGIETVSVQNKNDKPYKVFVNKVEKNILPGKFESIYWIENAEDISVEKAVILETNGKLTIGAVTLVDLKEYGRYSVIKIGKNTFIRRLPESYLDLNIMKAENSNE